MDGSAVALSVLVSALIATAYALGQSRGFRAGVDETTCSVGYMMTCRESDLTPNERRLLSDIRAIEAALRGE